MATRKYRRNKRKNKKQSRRKNRSSIYRKIRGGEIKLVSDSKTHSQYYNFEKDKVYIINNKRYNFIDKRRTTHKMDTLTPAGRPVSWLYIFKIVDGDEDDLYLYEYINSNTLEKITEES
jgi:hypothetical protein